jgi:hypothetical protein
MSDDIKRHAYEDLAAALSFAPGVNVGMCVNGRIFAVFENDALAVRIGPGRVIELDMEPGVGPFLRPGFDYGEWLLVENELAWADYADEAMRWVGSISDPRIP